MQFIFHLILDELIGGDEGVLFLLLVLLEPLVLTLVVLHHASHVLLVIPLLLLNLHLTIKELLIEATLYIVKALLQTALPLFLVFLIALLLVLLLLSKLSILTPLLLFLLFNHSVSHVTHNLPDLCCSRIDLSLTASLLREFLLLAVLSEPDILF